MSYQLSHRLIVRESNSLDSILGSDKFNVNPVTLPVESAGMSAWETMNPKIRQRVLGGMLRHVVGVAKRTPLYRDDPRWKNVSAKDIADIGDLCQLPLVSKDSVPGTGFLNASGIRGFRERVLENSSYVLPDNINELLAQQEVANGNHMNILSAYGGNKWFSFKSGGSLGKSTETRLSYLTVEAEVHALARALRYNGMKAGQHVACFYSPDHKGGLQLARAAAIMDMPFHSKNKIFSEVAHMSRYSADLDGFRRAVDVGDYAALDLHGAGVRAGIRDYIATHPIDVVESVQPPDEFLKNNTKGGALSFMKIYEEDPSAFKNVSHIFLTGFPVPSHAVERLRADGKEVSTTWGSTEVMALGTSGDNYDVNNLDATTFPAVGVVGRYKERGCAPHVEPVSVEEQGILLVTRLLPVGSLYIQYAIGDLAVRTRNGYKDIQRASTPDITGSCADDALSL